MLHRNLPPVDRHSPFTWIVANEAARLALTVASSDFAKICWQLDNDSFWVLKTHSPVLWIQFGGGILSSGLDGGTPSGGGDIFDGGTPSGGGGTFDGGVP